jgi:ATP-binding cassette, subfamily B (MDR/TAP), member 1
MLMFFGTAGALFNGVAFPLFSVIFGQMLDEIGTGIGNVESALTKLCLYFTGLAILSFIASFFQVSR